MVGIVHGGNGLTERLNTGGRGIFSRGNSDVDVRGPLEAALDIILDLDLDPSVSPSGRVFSFLFCIDRKKASFSAYLGSTLSKVCPLFRLVKEAKLASSLCAPYYTGRRTGGVKTSVGKMTSGTDIILARVPFAGSSGSLVGIAYS